MLSTRGVSGAGLGLRRPHLGSLRDAIPESIDFFEVAPENWIDVGGRLGRAFREIAVQRPLACHGLLLNLGGPDPLDTVFLGRLKAFLDAHDVVVYGDHLSFCAAHGHLYELLPIPFTEEAIRHVAARIRQVQETLGRRIAVENPSYYLSLSAAVSELDFIRGVVEEADCDLLLDINNVYVNAVNHAYDAREFLAGLPGERIAYAHIAGHAHDAPDLIVDTHGAAVIDPVWSLLEYAYQCFGVFPTMLERDVNIPPLAEVLTEVERIRSIQRAHGESAAA
ncbi:MAG: DUF692 domain-containing protein [Gammaproteobacteria bacterium]|nr:DUF692 domain-containing protein [Gammaproteobacteria bacterium]MCP5200771.1 DUF692 domain-containing protein [Gammaproteobacteria bacterium]